MFGQLFQMAAVCIIVRAGTTVFFLSFSTPVLARGRGSVISGHVWLRARNGTSVPDPMNASQDPNAPYQDNAAPIKDNKAPI